MKKKEIPELVQKQQHIHTGNFRRDIQLHVPAATRSTQKPHLNSPYKEREYRIARIPEESVRGLHELEDNSDRHF